MEAIALGRSDDTYRTHGRQIHRYIKSKVADDEEAEDILHEVFTRAAISVNASEHIENLVAWLFRSAIGDESFRGISEDTGVSINTLLARKRYAVTTLRKRLRAMQETIQELIT